MGWGLKNKRKLGGMKLFFALTIALQPARVWATADVFVPAPTPTPAPAPVVAPQNPTINQGSNTGQNSQNNGKKANNAAGAALIAAGAPMLAQPPTMPIGAMLIALGIMAMKQGSHDGNAAGQSGMTGAASAYSNAGNGSGVTQNPADPVKDGSSAFSSPAAKQGLAQIQELGYDVTDKGIKLPDGKILPTSTFSSPAAMAAAGIDPAVMKKVNEVNEQIAKQFNAQGVPVAGGGGGGGGAYDVGGGAGAGPGEGVGKFNPFAISDDAKKSLLAGKTVNLDGDPIGLRGMNIFDMIHAAYQKKRTGDQFLESDENHGTAASIRAPASEFKPATVEKIEPRELKSRKGGKNKF